MFKKKKFGKRNFYNWIKNGFGTPQGWLSFNLYMPALKDCIYTPSSKYVLESLEFTIFGGSRKYIFTYFKDSDYCEVKSFYLDFNVLNGIKEPIYLFENSHLFLSVQEKIELNNNNKASA